LAENSQYSEAILVSLPSARTHLDRDCRSAIITELLHRLFFLPPRTTIGKYRPTVACMAAVSVGHKADRSRPIASPVDVK